MIYNKNNYNCILNIISEDLNTNEIFVRNDKIEEIQRNNQESEKIHYNI